MTYESQIIKQLNREEAEKAYKEYLLEKKRDLFYQQQISNLKLADEYEEERKWKESQRKEKYIKD